MGGGAGDILGKSFNAIQQAGGIQPGQPQAAMAPMQQPPTQQGPDLIGILNQGLKERGKVSFDRLPQDQQQKLLSTAQRAYDQKQKLDK